MKHKSGCNLLIYRHCKTQYTLHFQTEKKSCWHVVNVEITLISKTHERPAFCGPWLFPFNTMQLKTRRGRMNKQDLSERWQPIRFNSGSLARANRNGFTCLGRAGFFLGFHELRQDQKLLCPSGTTQSGRARGSLVSLLLQPFPSSLVVNWLERSYHMWRQIGSIYFFQFFHFAFH